MSVIHYRTDRMQRYSPCGDMMSLSTCKRTEVTCKRCLASLAKADRGFRTKSRRAFSPRAEPGQWRHADLMAWNAARAVAAEEGTGDFIPRATTHVNPAAAARRFEGAQP